MGLFSQFCVQAPRCARISEDAFRERFDAFLDLGAAHAFAMTVVGGGFIELAAGELVDDALHAAHRHRSVAARIAASLSTSSSRYSTGTMTGKGQCAEMLRIGYLTAMVPVEYLDEEVDKLAAILAGNAPVAMRGMKRVIKRVRPRQARLKPPPTTVIAKGMRGTEIKEGIKRSRKSVLRNSSAPGGLDTKLRKTTPCKVEWAPARGNRAALRPGRFRPLPRNSPETRFSESHVNEWQGCSTEVQGRKQRPRATQLENTMLRKITLGLIAAASLTIAAAAPASAGGFHHGGHWGHGWGYGGYGLGFGVSTSTPASATACSSSGSRPLAACGLRTVNVCAY